MQKQIVQHTRESLARPQEDLPKTNLKKSSVSMKEIAGKLSGIDFIESFKVLSVKTTEGADLDAGEIGEL